MPLHRLTQSPLAFRTSPRPPRTTQRFGLTPSTTAAVRHPRRRRSQLQIVHSPMRRLVEVHVGADDATTSPGSLTGLIASGLSPPATTLRHGGRAAASGVRASVEVASRLLRYPRPSSPTTAPADRTDWCPGTWSAAHRPGPAPQARPHGAGHHRLGRRPGRFSSRASASSLATPSRTSARSCAAPPIITTCSSSRRQLPSSINFLAGRRHRRGRPWRVGDASSANRTRGTSGG